MTSARQKETYVRAGKVIDDVRAIARDQRAERDVDLVAVPWTDDASGYPALVNAIGSIPYLERPRQDEDAAKPHGRIAAVFLIKLRGKNCPRYVDLSVMPRRQKP